MSVRMETELKARLCYTNAKIYIKLLNEEREETLTNSTANGTDEVSNFEEKIFFNFLKQPNDKFVNW